MYERDVRISITWDCPCGNRERLHVVCTANLDHGDEVFVAQMLRMRSSAIRAIDEHEEKTDGTN